MHTRTPSQHRWPRGTGTCIAALQAACFSFTSSLMHLVFHNLSQTPRMQQEKEVELHCVSNYLVLYFKIKMSSCVFTFLLTRSVSIPLPLESRLIQVFSYYVHLPCGLILSILFTVFPSTSSPHSILL